MKEHRFYAFVLLGLAALGLASCGRSNASSSSSVASLSSSSEGTSSSSNVSSATSETSDSSSSSSDTSSASSSEESSSSSSQSTETSSSSSSESLPSGSELDPTALVKAQNAALTALDDCFNHFDRDDYSAIRFNKIIALLDQSKSAIYAAKSQELIDYWKAKGITGMQSEKTVKEAMAGTPFTVNTGAYDLDRDDTSGAVTVAYSAWPGDWVYVGNADYNGNVSTQLNHDPATQNRYVMSLTNSGSADMYVQFKMTNDAGSSSSDYYEVATDIVKLGANKSTDLVVTLAKKVTYLYFFVNSSYVAGSYPRLEGSGQLTITSFGFDYVKSDEPSYVNGAAILSPYAVLSSSSPYIYNLNAVKDPGKIIRAKITLNIDFQGAKNDSQWYGGTVSVGSFSGSYANNGYIDKTYAAGDKTNALSVKKIYSLEVSNLTATDSFKVSFDYSAATFIPTLQEVDFYYDDGLTYTSQTVTTSHVVFGDSKSDLSVPYSSFSAKGTVQKLVIAVTSLSNQTYIGGTLYIKGIAFNESHLVELGGTMVAGQSHSGTITIYPTTAVDLSLTDGAFSVACWWAPASSVTIDSLTLVAAA